MFRYEYNEDEKRFYFTARNWVWCPGCLGTLYLNTGVTCSHCGVVHHSECFWYGTWSCIACLKGD